MRLALVPDASCNAPQAKPFSSLSVNKYRWINIWTAILRQTCRSFPVFLLSHVRKRVFFSLQIVLYSPFFTLRKPTETVFSKISFCNFHLLIV
ncbi:DUF2684 family protein [Obesumbacterium proteus]|nr:DUF2684 family protein [Obesumbacterium proteus]